MLAEHRFRIAPRRLPHAVVHTASALVNSAVATMQQAWCGRAIRNTPIVDAPVFIIGHWRCGTTLLHELMALDPRHTAPNNYTAFSPHHFLWTERILTRCLRFLLPAQRRMDAMTLTWSAPQEDEFALCCLGIPTPYLHLAFPATASMQKMLHYTAALEQPRWQRRYVRYLRQLTRRANGRLILKSPLHAFRIAALRAMFPEARFVHIVRDPYATYRSTVHLWRTLHRTCGLQCTPAPNLEKEVLEVFVEFHQRVREGREEVPPNRFFELRYEDLIADPVAQLRQLYDVLELGSTAPAEAEWTDELERIRAYRPNKHTLSDATHQEIARIWWPILKGYGYAR
jgi:hypothetical protein